MPTRRLSVSLLLWGCWLMFALPQAGAQVRPGRNAGASPFKEVVLLVDTAVYTWSKNTVIHQEGKKLYFRYDRPDQVAEIRV
jgi:hypothetical protein